MAIVARERKNTIVYYVVFDWNGRQIWERAGTDRRKAEALESTRKREVAKGTFVPSTAMSGGTKVRTFAVDWCTKRTNRSADADRQRMRDYVLSRAWFVDMRIDDIKSSHVLRLVKEIKESDISIKTALNVYGALRTMFRDARLEDVIDSDPCVLPRGTFKGGKKRERTPYTRAEVIALTTSASVGLDRRVFAALAFYTGAREGEVCGLQWSDLDHEATPLMCITISKQYGGEILKTENARRVPVHPELALVLASWLKEGFELVYCRKPMPSDFIVPMRAHRANHHGIKAHHTKSSAYKLFRAACVQAGVVNRSLHSTRHSMITWARRGEARKEVLEKITHNAKGDIVDQYTHFDWDPLCEAMLKLRYLDAHPDLHRGGETPGKSGGAERLLATGNDAESHDPSATRLASIPGASNKLPAVKNKPSSSASIYGVTGSDSARPRDGAGRGSVGRLLRECVTLARGQAPDAEHEVSRRLRRVAKALPRTSTPSRRAGGAS